MRNENGCEHEAPLMVRQYKATPLPLPGSPNDGYAACVHCGAPLLRPRDTAQWTGWIRTKDGWAVDVGAMDTFPEYYTRDGLPPDE